MSTEPTAGPTAVDADESRVPWESPTLRVVLASTVVLPLGVPLLSPALPAIRTAFGVSDATVSLLVTVYFLPGVVLSPVLGVLADRVGRRRVLVPALLAYGVAGAAIPLTASFPTILVLRAVQGTAAAAVFIVTLTIVGDAFEGVRRNAVLGVNAAVLFVGAAVFPLLGGALVGRGWDVPFFAYLLALPVAALAAVFLPTDAGRRAAQGLDYLRGAVTALPVRRATPLYGATFAAELLGFGAILTALPFYLFRRFGLAPVAIGTVVTAVTAVSAAVAFSNGRLAHRVSDTRLTALAFVCFGLGLVGVWAAPTPALVGAAALVFGAGLGLFAPSVDAAISRLAPPEFRGGALSLRISTSFLGRGVGPVAFAAAGLAVGYHATLLAAGLLSLAAGLGATALTRS